MKTIILFGMSCLLSIAGISQTNNRFDFKKKEGSSSYIITPLFDQGKGEGTKGLPSILDDKYTEELFSDVIKEALSNEELSSLHFGSLFLVAFNTKGEILYCKFFIMDRDINIITENDLYKLYVKLKQIKIDTSKVKVVPGYNSEEKQPDYAEILGPLVPKDYNKNTYDK